MLAGSIPVNPFLVLSFSQTKLNPEIYTGLPQVFQANVLARVRVKSRGVRAQASKVRLKVQGKAEREQMLVGAARETHNSNSRSKAGLY